MVGGGGGQPLLASVGTSGVTGEKGTMSNMSVDCGFMETLPACVEGHCVNLHVITTRSIRGGERQRQQERDKAEENKKEKAEGVYARPRDAASLRRLSRKESRFGRRRS